VEQNLAEESAWDDGSRSTPVAFVVVVTIGAMFAPHHQPVADELVRVGRPGGTIGLLSWTPEGMTGARWAAGDPATVSYTEHVILTIFMSCLVHFTTGCSRWPRAGTAM
jgi:hypothetical protein